MVDVNKENCIMTDQYKRIQGAIIKIQEKNYPIYRGVNTIGRNKAAIINLKNLSVSQSQAVIVIVDDTQHFISDLNSTNGTYLQGTKLSPYKLYDLVNDVEIKFGDVISTYSKVSHTDTTIHLEMESVDMTQNMTQNFYGATTQIIDESSFNKSRPSNTPSRLTADELENIHEAATQVVFYPPNIADKFTEKSDGSSANDSSEFFNKDVHEAPTQVADYQLASTSAAQNGKLEKRVDIHGMATQVVHLPPELERTLEDNDFSTQIDEDVHKTDNSSLLSDKSSNDTEIETITQAQKKSDVTTIEETVIEDSHIEKDTNEDSNDSIDFLTIHKPFESELLRNKDQNSIDSNISDSQEIGALRKRPLRKLSSSEDLSQSQNGRVVYNSDSDTDIEKEIGAKVKIYDKNLPPNQTVDSGSDTEVEDLLCQSEKKRKVLDSDEETDIEDNKTHDDVLTQSQDIIKPKILFKKRVLDSDSETDIEDDEEKKPVPEQVPIENDSNTEILNDTDCIPPTQDAFADTFTYKDSKSVNVNSQNLSSEESFRLGLTELMVESVENKMEDVHKENTSDTFEGNTKNDIREADQTDNVEKKIEDNIPEGHKTSNVEDKVHDDILDTDKTDNVIVSKENINNVKAGESSNDHQLDNEGDPYMIPTQRVDSDILETERDKQDANAVTTQKSNDSSATSNAVDASEKSEDNTHVMPTQKLNEEKVENEDKIIPSTPKEVNSEREVEENLYMMPTQKLNENDTQPQFKTPQKIFSFKKKRVKLDASLSDIFSRNEDDPYSTPTQRVHAEKDESEDIYLQPTQKLNEDQKQNDAYLQPTQDLNLSGSFEASRDEDLYMAPTQEVNMRLKEKNYIPGSSSKTDSSSEKEQQTVPAIDVTSKVTETSNEDPYMMETQPTNIKNTDPYLQETQELGASKNTETNKDVKSKDVASTQRIITNVESKKPVAQCGSDLLNEEKDEDGYLAATQPINLHVAYTEVNKTPLEKSVTDLYLQETEDIGVIKNVEPNRTEKSKDPYMIPTQQINQDMTEKTSEGNDSLDGNIVATEINSVRKRHVTSDLNSSRPKRMKKITEADTETLSQIDAFIKQPLPVKRSIKIEPGSSNEGRKGTKEIIVDQSETLSQIQRFVAETSRSSKKSNNLVPKKGTPSFVCNKETTAVTEEDRPETLSQIEAFIKKPLDTIAVRNAATSKLQESDKISVSKEERSDEVFQKPERKSSRFRKSKQPITHVSKEECEIIDTSAADINAGREKSIDPSNSEQNTKKSDVEISFALLEAKSTRTRKSQRLTNSADVKVALCRNRRSMATAAAADVPDIIEVKPATRRLRRKSTNINNNVIPTTSDDSSGKTNQRPKRKLQPAKKDTDFEISESEKSSKILKTNTSKKSEQKEGIGTITELSSASTSKGKTNAKTDSKRSSHSDDFVDDAHDSVLSTPSRRSRRQMQGTPSLPSSEKGKRRQKPKIVFTMLDSPLLETLIRQLGGSIVDNVESSTVLVTEQVKRSQKLLTAIGLGKPICSPEWIHASKKANEFLDPWDFILLDEQAESKWDFSLKESLTRANNEKLLSNYSFQLMVSNATDVLKGAIEACGGKIVSRHPARNAEGFFVVVASPENRNKYLKVKKQHPQTTVVEPEAVFDGVLRQCLRLGNHLLT